MLAELGILEGTDENMYPEVLVPLYRSSLRHNCIVLSFASAFPLVSYTSILSGTPLILGKPSALKPLH